MGAGEQTILRAFIVKEIEEEKKIMERRNGNG
jgi:hypothetical protein